MQVQTMNDLSFKEAKNNLGNNPRKRENNLDNKARKSRLRKTVVKFY